MSCRLKMAISSAVGVTSLRHNYMNFPLEHDRFELGHSMVFCRFAIILLLLFSVQRLQGQTNDWSEKDLSKSVHRADETFKAGEMERAYGLFAHLVSVANDRAFVHFRFGATCTYSIKHLEEAEDHLLKARELGILESEYKADWHFYKGRIHQLRFEFDEAAVQFRQAIDYAPKKCDWIDDAKLGFGQCTNQSNFPSQLVKMGEKAILTSNSKDFYRLYDMPASAGRLLVVPEQLQSKEDKKRHYETQMHWLPSKRLAFYSSYGLDGDTGLDIYCVSIDANGEYGIPKRLPSPINGDFDDCAPICVPAGQSDSEFDALYFSSSRPESLGGYDIFWVEGKLTSPENTVILSNMDQAMQMPFEVNSPEDEFLFWKNSESDQTWLTTNRNLNFSGTEVWRFNDEFLDVVPVAFTFQNADLDQSGVLSIVKSKDHSLAQRVELQPNEQVHLALESGDDFIMKWELTDGTQSWEEMIRIPSKNSGTLSGDIIKIGETGTYRVSEAIADNTFLKVEGLNWTFDGMAARMLTGVFSQKIQSDEIAELRGQNIGRIQIERTIESAYNDFETVDGKGMPKWVSNALNESITNAGSMELLVVSDIRNEMDKTKAYLKGHSLLIAPGKSGWTIQTAIDLHGTDQTSESIELISNVLEKANKSQDDWALAAAELIRQAAEVENPSELIEASQFCEAQSDAIAEEVESMNVLLENVNAHQRINEWLSEALPMNAPGFKDDFSKVIKDTPVVFNAFLESASEKTTPSDHQELFKNIQLGLWNAFTDSIAQLQDLGVYDLQDMQDAQAWFLRSGGLMEEIQLSSNPLDQIGKGQQAIGLVWETYRAGADLKNQVVLESQMTPGSWWQDFGPKSTSGQAENDEEFQGYQLFVKHDDPILDQAHLYQKELDILRTASRNGEAYKTSMKRAIEMRSTIEDEMMALFGGESRPANKADLEREGIKSLEKVENTEPRSEIDTETTKATNAAVTTSTAGTEDIYSFTIQVGAFEKAPDFSNIEAKEDIFQLEEPGVYLKFGFGKFKSREDAMNQLAQVQTWAPDAFIKPLPTADSRTSEREDDVVDVKKTEARSKESTNKSSETKSNVKKKSVKSREKEAPEATNEPVKKFRVKIVEYSGTLKPSEVATLLRLGNEVPLKTRRLTNKTVYYSENFKTAAEAQKALKICLGKGFTYAEVEVIY